MTVRHSPMPVAAGRFLPLLLLAGALAGCLQGDPSHGTSFQPTCPYWTESPHSDGIVTSQQFFSRREGEAAGTPRTAAETFPFSGKPSPDDEQGRKVDRYHLRLPGSGQGPGILVHNGTLELRAFRNDTHQQLDLYSLADPSTRSDHLAWRSGTYQEGDYQVDLAPMTGNPSPAALRLEWTFRPDAGRSPSSGGPGGIVGAYYSVAAYPLYRAVGCLA